MLSVKTLQLRVKCLQVLSENTTELVFLRRKKRNKKHPELSSLEGCNLLGPGFWQMESSNCIAGDGRTFKYNEFDHLF